MPRFFFDFYNGRREPDDTGVNLENADAARRQVWHTLPAMAAQRHPDGNMACQLRMDVRDESGQYVFHAVLALVIEPAH